MASRGIMRRERKPAVQLRNVSKRFPLYGSVSRQMLGYLGLGTKNVSFKQAIDGISLTIDHGEKVGVVGHNGSGKTTLLRLITGFTRPTGGEIVADGSIQALMQRGYGFNDALSGIENIRNALIYNGLPPEALAAAEADIVDFVELGEFLHHPVKTYSLGMRARLEFAAATAIHPDVLVIDEVLGAGDGYFVHKCARRMRQLVEETTLLLVSHSLDQIREYCDRAIWIDGGRLREDGPVDQILANYRRYMSKQSSRLRTAVPTESQASVSARQRAGLLEKVRAMFGLPAQGGRIEGFSYGGDAYHCLSIETGDPLALRISAMLDKPMRPVVLGMTADGGFVFEMVFDHVLPAGQHDIVMRNGKTEVGVGNYVLIPALRDVDDPGALIIGEHCLELQLAVTNWSDPPLVHLDGEWRSGASLAPIASKVNAWV
jgi:ABC-type polysaccharide/polyol phosphate transport system ATPase subunit